MISNVKNFILICEFPEHGTLGNPIYVVLVLSYILILYIKCTAYALPKTFECRGDHPLYLFRIIFDVSMMS
jgi:hypothetical protein